MNWDKILDPTERTNLQNEFDHLDSEMTKILEAQDSGGTRIGYEEREARRKMQNQIADRKEQIMKMVQ